MGDTTAVALTGEPTFIEGILLAKDTTVTLVEQIWCLVAQQDAAVRAFETAFVNVTKKNEFLSRAVIVCTRCFLPGLKNFDVQILLKFYIYAMCNSRLRTKRTSGHDSTTSLPKLVLLLL